MPRNQFISANFSVHLHAKRLTKDSVSPISTEASQSPRDYFDVQPRSHLSKLNYCTYENKEKSQLCKKFVQNGFCPYKKKCKFAHGSHQLKKNKQLNSKYKTKECGVFRNQGFCLYGDRCNFIHQKSFEQQKKKIMQDIDIGFLQVKMEVRLSSRLLNLLEF